MQLRLGGVDVRGRRRAPTSRAQEPQREREHHEPLLRAVVEVALEPPALGVAGLDGPRPRRAQLLEPRPRLRLQALVVEREPGRRAHVLEQPRIVEQLGAVDDDGDRPPAAHERRDRSPVRVRRLDRAALGVHVAIAVERIGQLERPDRPSAPASASRSLPTAGALPSSMTSCATLVRARRPRTQAAATPSASSSSAAACASQSSRSTPSLERKPRSTACA